MCFVFEQEFVYHLVAFILLLIASVVLYLKIHDYPRYNAYNWHLSAAVSPKISKKIQKYLKKWFGKLHFCVLQIIGLVNSILYLASTALAYREYRYWWTLGNCQTKKEPTILQNTDHISYIAYILNHYITVFN